MNFNFEQIIAVVVAFVTPLLLTGAGKVVVVNGQKSQRRREMIAGANRAVVMLAKMTGGERQTERMEEERSYYLGLFWLEAKWMAESYEWFFMAAIQAGGDKKRVEGLSRRFLRDGKKFSNPVMRVVMGIYSKIWKRKNRYIVK